MTKSKKTAVALSLNPAEQSQAAAHNRVAEHKTATAFDRGVAPIVQRALSAPGQPLDPALRRFMEPRFRHDFSRVRVHCGPAAAASARALNARAFTVGRHIVLGQLPSRESEARFAMAHELAHTIQQEDSPADAPLTLGTADARAEEEADLAAVAVLAGHERPRSFHRVAGNIVLRLSGGAIAVLAVLGGGLIAGAIALIVESQKLMHWEIDAEDTPVVDDPTAPAPVKSALLSRGTRVALEADGHVTEAGGQKWMKIRVLLGPFAKLIGWVHKEQLASREETGDLTPEQSHQVFAVLSHAEMPTADGGKASIPFSFPADGCYSRAHRMEEMLTEMGFASQKVFALAKVSGLDVNSLNDIPGASEPEPEPDTNVHWWYHVAPLVKVRDPERGVIETVIDPSMGQSPMPLDEWEKLMTAKDKKLRVWHRLSLSEVRDRMKQQGGFKNADNSVVVAPRHTYFPTDLDKDHSSKEAEGEDTTMRPTMTQYAKLEPAAKLAGFIRGEMQKALIVLAVILDAIRKVTSDARKQFRDFYSSVIDALKLRMRKQAKETNEDPPQEQAEERQVDEELNK